MSKANFYRATALAFATALTVSIGCASQGGQGMGGCDSPTQNTLNCPAGTHQDPNQTTCTNPNTCCVKDSQSQLSRVEGNGSGGS